jgi:hypothetical protein
MFLHSILAVEREYFRTARITYFNYYYYFLGLETIPSCYSLLGCLQQSLAGINEARNPLSVRFVRVALLPWALVWSFLVARFCGALIAFGVQMQKQLLFLEDG